MSRGLYGYTGIYNATPITLDDEEGAALALDSKGRIIFGPTATDFEGGPVTVGTTAVDLTFTGATLSLLIQSDHGNSGKVWVGKANIDNTGANAMARLAPGEAITLDMDDSSNAIYAISDSVTQKIFKLALI